MLLINVDVVGPKRPQRPFQLGDHLLGCPVIAADGNWWPVVLLHGLGVELVAELGGDHPVVSLLADRLADERFGQVVAVALGGVHQVDTQVSCPPQQPVELLLGEALSPFAAELPGPDPDDRDLRPVLPSLRYFIVVPSDPRFGHRGAWHRPSARGTHCTQRHHELVGEILVHAFAQGERL